MCFLKGLSSHFSTIETQFNSASNGSLSRCRLAESYPVKPGIACCNPRSRQPLYCWNELQTQHRGFRRSPRIRVRRKTMACCGQRRQQMRRPAIPVRQANNPAKPTGFTQSPVQQQGTTFQYVGKTAIIAVGPMSGRQYRFGYPGAILQVDPRDKASLAIVPNLRQI